MYEENLMHALKVQYPIFSANMCPSALHTRLKQNKKHISCCISPSNINLLGCEWNVTYTNGVKNLFGEGREKFGQPVVADGKKKKTKHFYEQI